MIGSKRLWGVLRSYVSSYSKRLLYSKWSRGYTQFTCRVHTEIWGSTIVTSKDLVENGPGGTSGELLKGVSLKKKISFWVRGQRTNFNKCTSYGPYDTHELFICDLLVHRFANLSPQKSRRSCFKVENPDRVLREMVVQDERKGQ